MAAGSQWLHPSGSRFLDHIANKKADVVRLYLPPDTNCLLSCFDHCVRSRDYVNVLVTSKHPRPQWLTMEQAVKHCTQGVGIWDWASSDAGEEPDVVMACCGDTPTLETLAAVTILRDAMPELKIRVVNVVDLMKLEPTPSILMACLTLITMLCSPRISRSSSHSMVTRP